MNGYMLTYETPQARDSQPPVWAVSQEFYDNVEDAVFAATRVRGFLHRNPALYTYRNGLLKPIQLDGSENEVDVVAITPNELEVLAAYRDYAEFRKAEQDIRSRIAVVESAHKVELAPLDAELAANRAQLQDAVDRFNQGIGARNASLKAVLK